MTLKGRRARASGAAWPDRKRGSMTAWGVWHARWTSVPGRSVTPRDADTRPVTDTSLNSTSNSIVRSKASATHCTTCPRYLTHDAGDVSSGRLPIATPGQDAVTSIVDNTTQRLPLLPPRVAPWG